MEYNEAELSRFIIHIVGNKAREGDLILSENEIHVYDFALHEILKTYFFSHFKGEDIYQFSESSEIKAIVTKMFEDDEYFIRDSKKIAEFLYNKSENANIRSGELYVCKFENLIFGDELKEAIGIFKSEEKDSFLKIYQENDNVNVKSEQGIDIKRLDKACLVFKNELGDDFDLLIIDKSNREYARFWTESFLAANPKKTEFSQTKQVLQMCKDFATDHFTTKSNQDKLEQIDFLKNSMDFFENNSEYQETIFHDHISENPGTLQAFKHYSEEYQNAMPVKFDDAFHISENAVKRETKRFRSVIKLDKNFHVYVHGNTEYIQRGFDEETGLNYYVLYYENES